MNDTDIKFMRDMAEYWRKQLPTKEDSAHWSAVYNAENCDRIANKMITTDKALSHIEALAKSSK